MLALVLALQTIFAPDPPGPTNPGRYNYGASVLWDDSALRWRAWWCGQRVNAMGANIAGDAIWYADSADAATWTAARMVFEPSASGWDSFHVCDPSVLRNVKLGGILRPFVMYYTGANGAAGGDNDGRIGVAYSSDGIAWTRVQQLTLGCETAATYGCQHFAAVKIRENDPDPAFGGRYVATYSQTKTDNSTGTYAVESPDGLTWWGNAGAPGSPPQRLTFPQMFGSQYMSASVDLMYEPRAGRYLLTFQADLLEYIFTLPARWYGGIEAAGLAVQINSHAVGWEGSFSPGFFRAADGYRPWSPGADAWTLWTMTANRTIRDTFGQPRETGFIRIRWSN